MLTKDEERSQDDRPHQQMSTIHNLRARYTTGTKGRGKALGTRKAENARRRTHQAAFVGTRLWKKIKSHRIYESQSPINVVYRL